MASRLPDGSIQMANGRIIYGNSVILAEDICELVPILCPPSASGASVFPGLFRGGGGGFGGPGGGGGSPGPQGIPGPINRIQDEGINLPLRNALNFVGNGVVATDNPGAGATDVTINDLYAATRIVSTDPAQGTDLTIQAAIDNLPAFGGKIFVKDPQTISVPIVLSDKDICIEFAAGAEIDFGTTPGALFTIPNGLLKRRFYEFWNLTAKGGRVVGQTVLKLNDSNGFPWAYIYNPKISDFPIVADFAAGDAAYLETVRVYIQDGQVLPFPGVNPFVTTPNGAGTLAFPVAFYLDNVSAYTESDLTLGWTFDFDGDFIWGNGEFCVKGNSKCDGYDVNGSHYLQSGQGAGDMLELTGSSFYALGQMSNLFMYQLILKLSGFYMAIKGLEMSGPNAKITVNMNRLTVEVNAHYIIATDYCVDILSTGNQCQVTGNFRAAGTAVIRTAAKYGSFRCTFAATGIQKTVQEVGAADFNIAAGCAGLNTGGGVTQIGANSRYDLTLANT